MNQFNQAMVIAAPALELQPYISYYWLSLDNGAERYAIAPDGAVDVVAVIGAGSFSVDVFGTTTKRSDAQLNIGSHYLGIHFRPGQARHFLTAKTSDLTDAVHPAEGLLLPDLTAAIELFNMRTAFTQLDALLIQHLKRHRPSHGRIDDVISHIELTNGPLRVAELAAGYCTSRRQFERVFVDTLGISAKLFIEIIRFQRTSSLLATTQMPLAQIAATIGYTDQSHLTHEFARFFGQPPTRAREDVAFLQDINRLSQNN